MNLRPVALAVVALSLGCARTVSVDLTLVEPCDQKEQALNGVSSYVLSSSGEGAESVAFSVDEGAKALPLPLGDRIVSVEAYADDVSKEGAAAATPQAVGRTMPILIEANTADITGLVLMGKTNTFGQTTGADGKCTTMKSSDAGSAALSGRHGHTATFVPKLNKILLVGGAVWATGDGGALEERFLDSAELYDPATGTYEQLEGINSRAYHAATALPDGRVFISGGFGTVSGRTTVLKTALLFDPDSKAFGTLLLKQARAHHTSTLMPAIGIIALVGGCVGDDPGDGCTPTGAGTGPGDVASTDLPIATVETLDVENPSATVAVTNGLAEPRAFHQATVIGSGASQVLVITGGTNSIDGPARDVEFFRLEGDNLVKVDSTNKAPFPEGKAPSQHLAVALNDESLLVIGGRQAAPAGVPEGTGTNEMWVVTTASGVRQAPVATTTLIGRFGHVGAKMNDGSIIVIGGTIADVSPAAERISQQGSAENFVATQVAGYGTARMGVGLAVLPTNQLFVSGGFTTVEPKTTANEASIFFGR